LESGVAALGKDIEDLRFALKSKPELLELLPDAQIYHNAVRYALEDDVFYKTNDFAGAKKLLAEGIERARLLREGQAPWNTATGLVVRGYISKIDGSVQPYGLVVPPAYRADATRPYRLDFWYHGRNVNLTELSFITDREKNPGEFTPPNTFVVHLYGRYCNGNRFAGEVDLFETLDAIKRNYPIDENRILVRGFSMGGAATWHWCGPLRAPYALPQRRRNQQPLRASETRPTDRRVSHPADDLVDPARAFQRQWAFVLAGLVLGRAVGRFHPEDRARRSQARTGLWINRARDWRDSRDWHLHTRRRNALFGRALVDIVEAHALHRVQVIEVAPELLEAVRRWQCIGIVAQMVLAELAGVVTEIQEELGERRGSG